MSQQSGREKRVLCVKWMNEGLEEVMEQTTNGAMVEVTSILMGGFVSR